MVHHFQLYLQTAEERNTSVEIVTDEVKAILEEMGHNFNLSSIRLMAVMLRKILCTLFRRVLINREGLERVSNLLCRFFHKLIHALFILLVSALQGIERQCWTNILFLTCFSMCFLQFQPLRFARIRLKFRVVFTSLNFRGNFSSLQFFCLIVYLVIGIQEQYIHPKRNYYF